jgi:hypothetical protein
MMFVESFCEFDALSIQPLLDVLGLRVGPLLFLQKCGVETGVTAKN